MIKTNHSRCAIPAQCKQIIAKAKIVYQVLMLQHKSITKPLFDPSDVLGYLDEASGMLQEISNMLQWRC